MMLKISCFLMTLALLGCTSAPVAQNPAEACPPSLAVPIVESAGAAEINALLLYQASVRAMSPAELNKALTESKGQDHSGKTMMRRAMLLAALKGSGDLGRAQALLDAVLQADDADLKPLARLLGAHYGDVRRQDEAVEKLNGQIREAQRRNEQLNEKLEALKNIERQLSARPPAPAPTAK